jgi:enolase-phosphatase E1
MISFTARGVLLDVEGTTSSVHYVYDVLFPFARNHLQEFLHAHWKSPETRQTLDRIAIDAGAPSFAAWTANESKDGAQQRVIAEVTRLMDADEKTTGLKELQGLIWRTGFESGQLQSHVYDDVPPALMQWNEANLDVRIFSSGSVAAQKLFFRHTEHGDLLPYLCGHYDTTTGPKRAAASYRRIAADFGLQPAEILFLSDVVEELDAAREAGMNTGLTLRLGNPPVPDPRGHSRLERFDEIVFTLPAN